jgi:hypothetical protein
MAQTGYTPISIYYSSTATNVPTAGNLVAGELAINTADGKLFYKDSAGVVQVIGTKGGVGSSTTTQVLYNSSGLVVGSANMTFNGTSLTLANDASISGLTVGKGYGSLSQNTVFGVSALSSASLTGNYNTAVGYQAGYSNTTGAHNSFIGRLAGYSNTADNGTAIGSLAMQSNTTGASNTAVGFVSLNNNTTGSNNVAVGRDSLAANTTASDNTAVGYQSLYSNATGTACTAVGSGALYSNTASENSAFGRNALNANTSGTNNTALGQSALAANTTGNYNAAGGRVALFSNTTGANNTAFGTESLRNNTTASNNTAVGYQAGYANTTGTANTFLGQQSGYNATTANGNTLVGLQAGYSLTTGSSNTFVGNYNTANGYAAGYFVTTGSKNTIIGNYAGNQGGLDIRTSSNYIVLSDGDGNPRIVNDNNGRTILNGASPLNSSRLSIYETTGNSTVYLQNSNAAPYGMRITYSGAAPNSTDNWWLYCDDTSNSKFVIYSNGTAANRTGSYTSLSDIKIKQDVVDASSQWNDIKNVRVRKYRLKDEVAENPNFPSYIGVVAQEIEQTSPNLVEEVPDYEQVEVAQEDGSVQTERVKTGTTTKIVKYSILYMKAIKALQEAMERIEILEAKVQQLENK